MRGLLSARWTLVSKIAFSIITAAAVILVDVTDRALWSLPVVGLIPLAAAYLHLRARRTLRLGMALLDLNSEALGLTKVDAQNKSVAND